MNGKQQPKGSVLVMSIFIMLGLVGAGLAMAGIVRLQILQSRNEDNALRARYIAESGVERGLDILTDHRLQKQTGAATTLEDTLTLIEGLSGTLIGGEGKYSFDPTQTTEEVQNIQFALDELESKQIDLFDVDNPYTGNPYPVESIAIDWVEDEACVAHSSEVQLTMTQFDLVGSTVSTTPQEVIVPCGSFTPSGYFDCRLETNVPVSPNNYTLRIKAKNCSLSYAELSVYSVDGTPVGSEQTITSHSILTVNGTYGRSNSTLQVSAPWRPTPSGFLDYVLFVEGDLLK